MKKKLKELAELIGGQLAGPANLEIRGVNSLEEAGAEELSFVFDKKRFTAALKSNAKALVVPLDFPPTDRPVIRVDFPKLTLARILEIFEDKRQLKAGIHPSAVVNKQVKIGKDVYIGPQVIIEDGVILGNGVVLTAGIYLGRQVTLGEGSKIFPGVVVHHGTTIGANTIIHANAVIGADGFGYVQSGKKHIKIPQIGRVIIGNDVEIGANTTIDRATMGATVIGDGTKIDNLVQIAHNVKIGKNCLIAAQTGIAGSVEIGDNVILAGQAGIAEHVKIGREVIATARAAISKDVAPGLMVAGFPAQEFHKEMRLKATIRQLPELVEKIKKLEQKTKT